MAPSDFFNRLLVPIASAERDYRQGNSRQHGKTAGLGNGGEFDKEHIGATRVVTAKAALWSTH